LFTREESVEIAWQIVEPVLEGGAPPQPYEPGTWGPPDVQDQFAPPHGWADPKE
jgi:glucose-6-phosphate 1-dehydrogenase